MKILRPLKPGERVEFLGWGEDDPYSELQPGTQGTIELIDHAGTVHVSWDSGQTLGMVTRPFLMATEAEFKPDRFRRVADGD